MRAAPPHIGKLGHDKSEPNGRVLPLSIGLASKKMPFRLERPMRDLSMKPSKLSHQENLKGLTSSRQLQQKSYGNRYRELREIETIDHKLPQLKQLGFCDARTIRLILSSGPEGTMDKYRLLQGIPLLNPRGSGTHHGADQQLIKALLAISPTARKVHVSLDMPKSWDRRHEQVLKTIWATFSQGLPSHKLHRINRDIQSVRRRFPIYGRDASISHLLLALGGPPATGFFDSFKHLFNSHRRDHHILTAFSAIFKIPREQFFQIILTEPSRYEQEAGAAWKDDSSLLKIYHRLGEHNHPKPLNFRVKRLNEPHLGFDDSRLSRLLLASGGDQILQRYATGLHGKSRVRQQSKISKNPTSHIADVLQCWSPLHGIASSNQDFGESNESPEWDIVRELWATFAPSSKAKQTATLKIFQKLKAEAFLSNIGAGDQSIAYMILALGGQTAIKRYRDLERQGLFPQKDSHQDFRLMRSWAAARQLTPETCRHIDHS